MLCHRTSVLDLVEDLLVYHDAACCESDVPDSFISRFDLGLQTRKCFQLEQMLEDVQHDTITNAVAKLHGILKAADI